MSVEQDISGDRPRRGRPRKWPSEAARREHEAAKRRLRNKSQMTIDEFNDVRALTRLADELQRQVDALTKQLSDLEDRNRRLEDSWARDRRRIEAMREQQSDARRASALGVPSGNRADRRRAERQQRRPG